MTHILEEHANEVVGEISCGTAELGDKTSSSANCKLCQLKKFPKVVVVICDDDVKPEEAFLWTQRVRLPFCVISLSDFIDTSLCRARM